MAFFGDYTVSLTNGGRIVIPKKIRENLKGEVFVLTKGFDSCLSGYDLDDWNTKTKALLSDSILEKENIEKKRFVFSGANHLSIDDQGRMVIPKSLVDFMQLSDDRVKIIGVGDHFEIWDLQVWKKYEKSIKI